MSERKSSQRYLSGRVKVTGFSGLSSDRHLYIAPGEVEPNLGYPGEKSIPISNDYYQLITIPNGTTYDRYWQQQPGLLPGGISVFDEGFLVGTANSISQLNFVGVGVTATASGTISTITISTSAKVAVSTEPPGGASQGDLWWDSDLGELFLYYQDGNSDQWVETSGGSETVTISDTAPPSPNTGDLWWDSDDGVLYIYYDDGDSEQWIDATGGILDSLVNFWTATGVGIHTLGKVGIGTTNATDTLTVVGNVNVSGVITASTFSGSGSGLTGVSTNFISAIGIQSGGLPIGVGITQLNFIGVGNTFAVRGTTVDISIAGGTGVGAGTSVVISDTPPVSPSNGDLWWESDTGDLKVYYVDGDSSQWVSANAADSLVQISTSAPSGAQSGDLWWDSETGNLFVYYNDGDSSQWISASANSTNYWIANNAGIHTLGKVGISTNNPRYSLEVGAVGAAGTSLWVNGDARITGILTVGTSSITLNGITNQVFVGTGITMYGNTGIVSTTSIYAHKFFQNGSEIIGTPGAQGSAGAQGATGATGAQGSQGATGATGAQGATGTAGVQGATGTTGSQGATGATGAQGAQGAAGGAGTTGAQGAQGTAGAQGSTGATGAQGSAGAQGTAGAQGSTGATGAQGSAGAQGATGAQGSNGAQGSTGAQGSAGAQGSTGAQGTAGAQGAAGAQGSAGAQGATGATGAQGSTGSQGAAGSQGSSGAQGAIGSTGAQGSSGSQGASGAQGSAGAQGATGGSGTTGAQGATGSTGAQGAQGSVGPVAGSNTQLIYNNNGSAAGASGLTWNGSSFSVSGSYRANTVAVSALDIDCSAGNYFTKTINGNSTFTVSNVPSGVAYSFILELTHTSGSVTWFSGVEWPSSSAPSLTTGKTHLFMFITDDGGSRWRAASYVNYTT